MLSLGIRGFKTGHLYININKYDWYKITKKIQT